LLSVIENRRHQNLNQRKENKECAGQNKGIEGGSCKATAAAGYQRRVTHDVDEKNMPDLKCHI
jgi:hypothetical protein